MKVTTSLLTLLCALPAQADILMPGTKGISHTFEIQGLEEAPEGTTLFAYPTHFSGGCEVHEGSPFTFYKFCSPRLYAITGPLPTTPDGDLEPLLEGLPASEQVFSIVSSVPEWSATESIHTVYNFAGIEDGVIRLQLTSETHRGADGQPLALGGGTIQRGALGGWLVLPAVGALILAGSVVRRRRAAVSA